MINNKHILRTFVYSILTFFLMTTTEFSVSSARTLSDDSISAKRNSVNAYKSSVKKKVKLRKKVRTKKLAKRKKYKREKYYAKRDLYDPRDPLRVASTKAIVINQVTGERLYSKNTREVAPIASVTKLMTAMVMLDAGLPMDDYIVISNADIDYLKGTSSRLPIGTVLPRQELLTLALMSSENRAAAALSRVYPGGRPAFIRAMNRKAAMIGMQNSHFVDPTGLSSSNVSTAEDLVKMVNAAYQYDEIRAITTTSASQVMLSGRSKPLNYVNTNALVRGSNWNIGVSKTGYINEAGRCLVMQAELLDQPVIIVLLDSNTSVSRINDAKRIRKWYEYNYQHKVALHASSSDIIN